MGEGKSDTSVKTLEGGKSLAGIHEKSFASAKALRQYHASYVQGPTRRPGSCSTVSKGRSF